jgi:hypothetical protein
MGGNEIFSLVEIPVKKKDWNFDFSSKNKFI